MASKPTKTQELHFSGPPTTDLDALHRALIGARRADVTVGGYLIHPVNPDDDVLDDSTMKRVTLLRKGRAVSIGNVDDLVELFDALRVDEVTGFICMCTGDYSIEFFDESSTLVDVVRIDLPDRVESRHWPGAARLANPDQLHTWLGFHGFDAERVVL